LQDIPRQHVVGTPLWASQIYLTKASKLPSMVCPRNRWDTRGRWPSRRWVSAFA